MTESKKTRKSRVERDALGTKDLPADAYYGIQTQRAVENFPVSGIMPVGEFIWATAVVKRASAEVNTELGLLDKRRGRAIIRAADEVMEGKLHGEFVVDVYQAGAGTSHNMNANEVIANRAIELLGGTKGDYSVLHPNDHVNMSQSTNDTVPTAMRLAAVRMSGCLLASLRRLEVGLRRKARSFGGVVKSARTHLRDAVPIMLGQEFSAYAESVKGCRLRIQRECEGLKLLGIGGTAAGTGVNTHPRYTKMMIRALRRLSGIRGLKPAPDMVEATSSMAAFVSFSGALKTLSVELTRIANDLRLLSSGPRTGLSEIRLPPVQPGSSMMPGKVNPVMAEMLNMVCFQVMGADHTVTMASQAGQLELNPMMPVINHNILHSVKILTNAVRAFTERCIKGIRADRRRCREYFERSVGLATVLSPALGHEETAALAAKAEAEGLTIRELISMTGIFTEEELDALFDPARLTRPQLGAGMK